jgi:hypothetical protein
MRLLNVLRHEISQLTPESRFVSSLGWIEAKAKPHMKPNELRHRRVTQSTPKFFSGFAFRDRDAAPYMENRMFGLSKPVLSDATYGNSSQGFGRG